MASKTKKGHVANSKKTAGPVSIISINPAYTRPGVDRQILAAFNDNDSIPNIKLGQILSPSAYDSIKQAAGRATMRPAVAPLEYRFSSASLKLDQLSDSLSKFLKPIFGIETGAEWKLVSLTWKDYSMLLDTQKTRNGFDIIIDISDDFPQNAGGDLVYTTGGKDTVEIPPSENTLIIVKINEKTRGFMRYVNHYGKQARRTFLIQHI